MIPDNSQFYHHQRKYIFVQKSQNYLISNFVINLRNTKRSLKQLLLLSSQFFSKRHIVVQANTFKQMDIEAYEKNIQQNSCDLERISILQRKSRTRLQLVNLLNHSFIRSNNDKHKNLRLLLFGLLRSIYALKDAQFICIIKQIVYSSSLNFITNSNGVLKEELHRIMCDCLRKIQEANEVELEDVLLRSFNCVGFFDQVLLTSFKEYFRPNYTDSLPQWIKIFQQHFTFTIKVNEGTKQDKIQEQPQTRQLWFEWVVDGLYLPSINQQTISNPDIDNCSQQSFQQITGQKKDFMAVAIQSCESPTYKKQNSNIMNLSSNKKNLFNSRVEIPEPKMLSRHQKRSFWSLFCCTD